MLFGRWTIRTRRGRAAGRAWAVAGLAVAAGGCGLLSGCGGMQMASNSWQYNSSWNNFVAKHRNSGMASKAWHRRKHGFCKEACLDQFCDGFRDGYMSVADGGDGCTPTFPPREYWGWQYQSGEGQQQVGAWFAGFPHGARAAEEDGVGNWSQIQTSFATQQNFDRAGLLGPGQRPGMYPMPEACPPCEVAAKQVLGPADGIPAAGMPEAVIGVDPATGVIVPATPVVPLPGPAPVPLVPGVAPPLPLGTPSASAAGPQAAHTSSLPNTSRLVR